MCNAICVTNSWKGLRDPEIPETLLREEARSSAETVNMAVDLESIASSMRNRRNMRTATVRVAQEVATPSSPNGLEDLKKQMNELTEAATELTKVMTQIVGAYGRVAPDGGISNRSSSKDCHRGKRAHCHACGSHEHFA